MIRTTVVTERRLRVQRFGKPNYGCGLIDVTQAGLLLLGMIVRLRILISMQGVARHARSTALRVQHNTMLKPQRLWSVL